MKPNNSPRQTFKLSLLFHGVLPNWSRLLTCRVLGDGLTNPSRQCGISDSSCPRYNSWSITHALPRSDHNHVCFDPCSRQSLILVRKKGALTLRRARLCQTLEDGGSVG